MLYNSKFQVVSGCNPTLTGVVYPVGALQSDYYAQSFIANVKSITKFGVVIREHVPDGQVILAIAADDGTGKPNVNPPLPCIRGR